MKLISINIQNNLHNEKVLELVKKENANVVCMQELLEEDFDFFKRSLNMDGVFCIWRYIEHSSCRDMIGKKEGVAIFSKNIVESGSIFYKGKKENMLLSFDDYISSPLYSHNNGLAWVVVNNNIGLPIKIVTTHLPVTQVGMSGPYVEGESTPFQLEIVDKLINTLKAFGELVLCGDMNAPRGRGTFTRLSKTFKDNIPETYKTSLDQNLHRVKGLQLMVDGLFTTPLRQVSNVKLVDGISDHMAIVAEIN